MLLRSLGLHSLRLSIALPQCARHFARYWGNCDKQNAQFQEVISEQNLEISIRVCKSKLMECKKKDNLSYRCQEIIILLIKLGK